MLTSCPCGDACRCHAGGLYAPCDPEYPAGCGAATVQRCRRDRWCAGRDPQGNAAPASRALCDPCLWHLANVIRDLPALLQALEQELPRTYPTDTGYDKDRPGSRDLPILLRAGVDELMRAIVDTARCWEEIVRDVAGLGLPAAAPRSPRGAGPTLHTALLASVVVLEPRISVLIALPPTSVERDDAWFDMDGGDAALELIDLYRQGERITGRLRRTTRYTEPCASCGVRAMLHRDGDPNVWCGSCGAIEPWEKFDERRQESA